VLGIKNKPTWSPAVFLIASCLLIFFYGYLHSASAESIQLQREANTYTVPVQINGAITLPFVLDSGASNMVIPADVFLTLLRSGTVNKNDFIGTGVAVLADGSRHRSDQFILHQVRVGDHVMRNVVASVAPVRGDPLLGQSFLSKLPAWTIDNQRHTLVLDDGSALIANRERSALSLPQSMPSGAAPILPTVSSPLSITELEVRGHKAQTRGNYSEAMSSYQSAFAQGSASAANSIGILYAEGLGVSRSYAEAMRWIRMAADRGNASAQNNIGFFFLEGLGVSRDYSEAMRWYRLAASQGNSEAVTDIGRMYMYGWGVPRNYGEAMVWFRRASGNARAENGIGVLYAEGWGMPQNYNEAMIWFRRAADAGASVAEYNLGRLYLGGLGVSQNYSEAMRWFQLAADQIPSPVTMDEAGRKSIAESMNAIGWMAARGNGVGKDCVVAKGWLERAAAGGSEAARKNLSNGIGGACSWSVP
jgi:TPR repeat protein